mmetsp:Transcript_16071/g.31064  ORF Transcript_16071/g.31064 Transcript_16071/m.31064 type:complete len:218 (+) Transcript_16071:477-1130(+)
MSSLRPRSSVVLQPSSTSSQMLPPLEATRTSTSLCSSVPMVVTPPLLLRRSPRRLRSPDAERFAALRLMTSTPRTSSRSSTSSSSLPLLVRVSRVPTASTSLSPSRAATSTLRTSSLLLSVLETPTTGVRILMTPPSTSASTHARLTRSSPLSEPSVLHPSVLVMTKLRMDTIPPSVSGSPLCGMPSRLPLTPPRISVVHRRSLTMISSSSPTSCRV